MAAWTLSPADTTFRRVALRICAGDLTNCFGRAGQERHAHRRDLRTVGPRKNLSQSKATLHHGQPQVFLQI